MADEQGDLERIVETRATIAHIRVALLIVRHFCMAGGSEAALAAIRGWVDDGMGGAIPWPRCPAFAAWASRHGLRNVEGRVACALGGQLAA